MKRMVCRLSIWAILAIVAVLTAVSVNAQNNNTVTDPAFQALSAGNVYVDPLLKHINQATLEQAAQEAGDPAAAANTGDQHTIVKIAALKFLPPGFNSRAQYAKLLHDDLSLQKNGLVIVVFKGQDPGISVISDGLSQAQAKQLADAANGPIHADETQGIADLTQNATNAINGQQNKSTAILWIVFLVVALGIIGLLISGSVRKRRLLAEQRVPIEALRANVLSGIEYLDNYADVLPKNNPDSDAVRQYRQLASNKLDQAAKILINASETSDLNRAQGLLDRAQADIQEGRRALDRCTGGTGNIPGDDAMRPQPIPASQPEVESIPQSQRGVSFFSSQPAPLGSLVPVTITVNGQERQVLVTPEEANELRQGRMPQVRAFNVNGQNVPWYSYNQYDPYRDYWGYQNSGWGGFGGGLAAGFIGAELLEDLFAPHHAYGMGYSPYSYSTDTDYYRGYSNSVYDPGFGGGFNDVGGSNFLNDGGGYGQVDTSNVGNSDFLTDAGSNQGGNDFGGSDFGGSDFGGSDFGGGDFGGGDSGGGSDF